MISAYLDNSLCVCEHLRTYLEEREGQWASDSYCLVYFLNYLQLMLQNKYDSKMYGV